MEREKPRLLVDPMKESPRYVNKVIFDPPTPANPQMSVATRVGPDKIIRKLVQSSHRTVNKINHCCFESLSFEVVYCTAVYLDNKGSQKYLFPA